MKQNYLKGKFSSVVTKFTVVSAVFFAVNSIQAQTNTLPPSGNVGIGTTNPTSRLQVNGTAQIDSSLYVKDSIIIQRSAVVKDVLRVESDVIVKGDINVKNDLKVKGKAVFKGDAVVDSNVTVKNDLKVNGKTTLKGDVVIKEGDLKLKDLGDTSLQGNGVLMINQNGKVVNGGNIHALMYKEFPQNIPCFTGLDGSILYEAPAWEASTDGGMFLLQRQCTREVRLGVGVKPTARFHILNSSTTLPLLIEKKLPNNQPNYKLLQLDHNGLLSAREVKVDLTAWPDYVFKKEYELMPLKQVDNFIRTNGHLPNVPKAETIETEGLNLGEMNKLLMQKVEELTLYLIEQQKLIEAQQKRIEALENQNK